MKQENSLRFEKMLDYKDHSFSSTKYWLATGVYSAESAHLFQQEYPSEGLTDFIVDISIHEGILYLPTEFSDSYTSYAVGIITNGDFLKKFLKRGGEIDHEEFSAFKKWAADVERSSMAAHYSDPNEDAIQFGPLLQNVMIRQTYLRSYASFLKEAEVHDNTSKGPLVTVVKIDGAWKLETVFDSSVTSDDLGKMNWPAQAERAWIQVHPVLLGSRDDTWFPIELLTKHKDLLQLLVAAHSPTYL